MFERCLYFNVNALARRVNAIWDDAFAEFDLSPAHTYLLRLVLENPGITQTRIAEELRLEKSTVTRFIHVLEDKGMVKRARAGRETLVQPTAQAKKIRIQLERKGELLYQRMQAAVGNAELGEMVQQLRDTAACLGSRE